MDQRGDLVRGLGRFGMNVHWELFIDASVHVLGNVLQIEGVSGLDAVRSRNV